MLDEEYTNEALSEARKRLDNFHRKYEGIFCTWDAMTAMRIDLKNLLSWINNTLPYEEWIIVNESPDGIPYNFNFRILPRRVATPAELRREICQSMLDS